MAKERKKRKNILELLFVLHQEYEVEKLVAYTNLNVRKFNKTWGFRKIFCEQYN